jgi:FixJ family two-component response regulator
MPSTVYVIEPDPNERSWIRSALASNVDAVVFLDDCAALLASPRPGSERACLIASAEPDQAATLKLVRDLRSSGATLPVIVLGPHTAFRMAVEIARLPATDFLERPVTIRQLRAAVRKALDAVA